jgi:hypothetical protein
MNLDDEQIDFDVEKIFDGDMNDSRKEAVNFFTKMIWPMEIKQFFRFISTNYISFY